jgi:hypothetical protein
MNTTAPQYQNLPELESITLFDLIGIQGTAEEEKAMSLKLANGIWQDWITAEWENFPEAAMEKLEEILNEDKKDDERFEKEVGALIEEHMPEAKEQLKKRTIELKAEMVLERISGLREFHKNAAENISTLNEAEELADKGEWEKAVALLNQLSK